MVTDGQVKELRRLLSAGKSLAFSARMTEMNEKTARTYRDDGRLPSQRKTPRQYRTRRDPFSEVWPAIEQRLEQEPRLKAKTLFEWLQEQHPGEFPDSTRRTFERRVSQWRTLHGPDKPVYFTQQHHPGRLAASDFTVMNELGVKIAGKRFDHLLFHCVLTYSNVESISLCFGESFEALSAGIQKAFWEFGGVPQRHRTDSLSAAVRNHSNQKQLTQRYSALMDYYQCCPEKTNARCANENGDVESSHGHLKDRIDQALLLRGSRDFASRDQYVEFVEALIAKSNGNRQVAFLQEQAQLNRLPDQRLDTDDQMMGVRVTRSSTIKVRTNTYSVPSRLIGKKVDVRIGAEELSVSFQGHPIQTMPRLVGKHGASINYLHVIDSLVCKPGALENYRYREEMFPTSHFRMAYDILHQQHAGKVADKKYIEILQLAAHHSQEAVQAALRLMITSGERIEVDQVRQQVEDASRLPEVTDVEIDPVNLSDFDALLHHDDMEDIDYETDDQQDDHQANQAQAGTGPAVGPADPGIVRSVSGTTIAELSGSLSGNDPASQPGGAELSGLPVGVDDARMR